MTIRYLEIFTEVCRHMSMSKAARALMISQSSVSQAVKALEQEYGVLLFERLNHTLYLTPAGEKLLYLATQVLKSIDKLNAAMLDAPQTLNIGSCNTVGASILYPLIAGFKKQYPKVHVSAEISNTQTLTEKILNGRLDLAIIPETRRQDYFNYLPFFEDDIAVICHPAHPLAGQKVQLAALQQEVFVGRETGSATETLLKNIFDKHGFTLKIDCVCNSTASVKQAVRHKMGIAVISRYLVKRELAEHMLACINVSGNVFTRRFALIYHKDKLLTGEFTDFTAFCRQLGQQGLENLMEDI